MSVIEQNHIVSLRILGKNYNIKCPPEQAEALQESARIIEHKLRDLKQSINPTNVERMLMITALNLSHELLALKNERSHYLSTVEHKLQALQSRIQTFLTVDEELTVS